jgi:hypothetical protein
MDNHEIEFMKREINRLARRGELRGRFIVLFGAASPAKEVEMYLSEKGFHPGAVIDTDSRKVGRQCLGMTVQRPEDVLLPMRPDAAILLCSISFCKEMSRQLVEMGYREGRHILLPFHEQDDSLSTLLPVGVRLARGWLTHRELARKYPPGSVLFIAPYTGTGDVYLAGLFFEEYCRRHSIGEYAFVVVNSACRKVAQAFGIRNIELVSRIEVDDIINCDRALKACWPLVILNDSWAADYTNLLQWLRGYKGLTFDKMFRYFVFGFDDSVPYALPSAPADKDAVAAIFAKHGLIPGRTVVLSPYSNTLFEPPDDLWRAVVDFCSQRGYTVCTNCAGAEKPVEGTAAVFFPLGQASAFMDMAGYFVGVRSGLCDIISSSTCRKVVLYEKDGYFYKCSPYDYFSLEKMGLCSDAVEIEYRADGRDMALAAILGIFGNAASKTDSPIAPVITN